MKGKMQNMNQPLFFYDRQSKLYEYDENLSKKLYFPQELNNTVQTLFSKTKKQRYILFKEHLSNAMFLTDCKESKTKDGLCFESCDKKILLIPVGINVYFLAYSDASGILLNSLLYTFIQQHQCVIDVSKYFSFFKGNCYTLSLYKKK